jgi:replicative DNA helicase
MLSLPIWLDDTPGLTVEQIYRKIRRLAMREGIDAVWVDYLQLIQNSGVGTRQDVEVGHMSRMLKKAAKKLDVPVIALSQLNRGVEHRGEPVPKLSDLRDSGNIEQDADVVIFIYRPEEYGITTDDSGRSTAGIAKLIVSKHRGGPRGTAVVQWNDKYASFENLARRESTTPDYAER